MSELESGISSDQAKSGDEPAVETGKEESLSDFLYLIALNSPPDRYGTVGEINFAVDWRPKNIEIMYRDVRLTPGIQLFSDDHTRSFNNQLANGGRDMREFSLIQDVLKKETQRILDDL